MPKRFRGKRINPPPIVKTKKITVIRAVSAMQRWGRENGAACGLVPTLGALHEGHVSLIKKARAENKTVAVSVFVNPLQFREKQYLLYPRTLAADVEIAKNAGADVVFAPSAEQMYPAGFDGEIVVPSLFGRLKPQKLEWHYKGVLAVVMKLFNLARPRNAYFGLKDPHQLALIEKMVADFNIPVRIRKCPTVREGDGLARSSRNALLTPEERRAAPVIYRALLAGKRELKQGASPAKALAGMRKIIAAEKLARPEHIEIVDPLTFAPVGGKSHEALIFAAVWIGEKRLADNVRFRMK